jgi:acyl carrier protein/GNAT superfamily N-acetyltransferase
MNRTDVEKQLVDVLRRSSLSGSDREIDLGDPLGEQGLGLDSLALVEFVTAVENRFQVELPDEIWTERDKLSIRHCADLILDSGHEVIQPVADHESRHGWQNAIGLSWSKKASSAFRELGTTRALAWMVGRVAVHIADWVYLRQKNYILKATVAKRHIPRKASSLDLDLRQLSADDAVAFDEFCSSVIYVTATSERMNLKTFHKRMEAGHVCLGAWYEDRIVGVDWLTDEGYRCRSTGLYLHWASESCFAMELYEHPAFLEKGIGLALIGYSLALAKERGYREQVTMVLARNVRMLSAAVQLFGYQKVGEIETRRILFKPFSKWSIGGRSGWGGEVLLSP